MTIAEQLSIARAQSGFDLSVVAQRLDLSEAAVRHHHNGTRAPDVATVAQYAALYRVSTDWLITGKGRGPDDPTAEVLDYWGRVPISLQDHALSVLKTFADKT